MSSEDEKAAPDAGSSPGAAAIESAVEEAVRRLQDATDGDDSPVAAATREAIAVLEKRVDEAEDDAVKDALRRALSVLRNSQLQEDEQREHAAAPLSLNYKAETVPHVDDDEQVVAAALVAVGLSYKMSKEVVPVDAHAADTAAARLEAGDRVDTVCEALRDTIATVEHERKVNSGAKGTFHLLGIVANGEGDGTDATLPHPVLPLGVAPTAVLLHRYGATSTLFVVSRGSTEAQDWMTNFDVPMVPWPQLQAAAPAPVGRAMLHRGFLRASEALFVERDAVNDEDEHADKERARRSLPEVLGSEEARPAVEAGRVVFCGHSLGAATAQVNALRYALLRRDAALHGDGQPVPPLVVTFSSPRVGNDAFVDCARALVRHVRVYHDGDPVPRVPSKVVCPAGLGLGYGRHAALAHARVDWFGASDRRAVDDASPPDHKRRWWKNAKARVGYLGVKAALYHKTECLASAFGGASDGERAPFWPFDDDRNPEHARARRALAFEAKLDPEP